MSDPRIHSPAATRNREPILEVLRSALPESAGVLEIASGSGEHAVFFAGAEPGWMWQPSDATDAALASIAARCGEAGLANLKPPIALDVLRDPWPDEAFDAVVAINLIHIAPWSVTEGLMAGAADHLPHDGRLVLYGPFRRNGAHTAPSNAAFDADLQSRDPRWGIRDLGDVTETAAQHGFVQERVEEMPANNLTVVFRRDASGPTATEPSARSDG